jgi:8-oxo-dGTP diphosphatase
MKNMKTIAIITGFLTQEKARMPLTEMWVNPERQRLSSLCYLERNEEFLLLQRNKEPFRGFWTAPGGKLEAGEDPREAIIREIREETGFTLINPCLKVITSETGSDFNYNWLLFIFHCTEFSGTLQKCNEGTLQWIPKQQVNDLNIPDVDRRLLPFIFDYHQRYFMRLEYNDQYQVSSFQKFAL